MKPKRKYRQLGKKMLSFLLVLSMIAPEMAPMVSYAAEALDNRARQVEFARPQALTPGELGLASGSDAKTPEDNHAENEPDKATASDAELRAPEFFYTELPEEPDGRLVQYSEKGRTYLMDENVGTDENGDPINSYITVVGRSNALYQDEDGFIREYDNTLVPSDGAADPDFASPSEAGRLKTRAKLQTSYQNAEGDVKIELPERMMNGRGYMMSSGEDTIEVIPTSGNFADSLAVDNAIRYSNVFENVDFQYTVIGDTLKEDIILLAPQDKYEFTYQLKSDTLKFKKDGSSIAAYKTSYQDPLFRITAPVAIDAEGNTNTDIRLSYSQADSRMRFTVNREWLQDENRAYPVRIDPGAALIGYDAFSINMVAKGDTAEFAGTDEKNEKVRDKCYGETVNTMVGYSEYYGHCRALIGIDTAWESLIDHPDTKVDGPGVKSIQFSIGVMTNNAAQRTPFMLRVPKNSWEPAKASWNEMEKTGVFSGSRPTGLEAYSNGAGSRLEFDITDTYYGWVNEPEKMPRYGLLMEVEAENAFDPTDKTSVFWAETFYSGSDAANGPRIEVAWTGNLDGKDLATLPMSEFSLDIGPGIVETDAGGRSTRGILAFGASQAGSTVEYELVEKDGGSVAEGLVEAHEEANCPDYQEVDPDCIWDQYQDANWQSEPLLYTGDLETDTVYYVKAQGTGQVLEENPETGELEPNGEEDVSEEKTSDEFLLYEVQATDLLPRIARHYGVTVAQIKKDNQFLEQLTVAGNILFIRNPKTAEPYTRKLSSDQLEDLLEKCLLAGLDPRCEWGMEPVNLSNGSFYMSQTDAELPELGGNYNIERSYNSLTPYFRSEFGMGWNSLVGEKIMVLEDGTVIFVREDGKGLIFEKTGDGLYQAPDGYDYELQAVDSVDAKTDDTVDEEDHGAQEKEPKPEKTEATLSNALRVEKQALRTDAETAAEITAETAAEITAETAAESPAKVEAVPSSLGWEITQPDGTVKQFNSNGLLVSETDRKGYTTYYVYDSTFNLNRIITPSGKEFGITQTDRGLITDITLPDGGTLHYDYNEEYELISVTNQAGTSRRYEYDGNHRMTAWYDENGSRIVLNTYDDQGRVTVQEDALGSTGTFEYQEGLTILTDNNGNVTRYYLDDQNRNIRVQYANGDEETTTYSEDNRIASKTNANGAEVTYTYDENGNILTESRQDGSTAEFTYNELNLPVTATDYEGYTSTYTYGCDNIGLNQKTLI